MATPYRVAATAVDNYEFISIEKQKKTKKIKEPKLKETKKIDEPKPYKPRKPRAPNKPKPKDYSRSMFKKPRQKTPSHIWHKCQICTKVYETNGGCQNHLSLHHGIMDPQEQASLIVAEEIDTSFPCQECGEAVQSLAELAQHLRQHHGQLLSSAFKCRQCFKAMDSREETRNHLRTVHNLANEKEIDKNVALIEEAVLRCSVCGALFPCKSNLIRHRNRYHSTDVQRDAAAAAGASASRTSHFNDDVDRGGNTSSSALMWEDIKPLVDKSGNITNVETKHTSSVSDNPFNNTSSSSTITEDVKPFISDDSNTNRATNGAFISDTSTVFPRLKCPFYCRLTFDNKIDLQNHVMMGYHEKPDNRTDLVCTLCKCRYNLDTPCACIEDAGNKQSLEETQPFGASEKKFLCFYCPNFSFSATRQRLQEHYRKWHKAEIGPDKFSGQSEQCDVCYQTFYDRGSLNHHLGMKHGIEAGYAGQIKRVKCDQTFDTNDSAEIQRKKDVSQNPPPPMRFKCGECDEIFNDGDEIAGHYGEKHGKKIVSTVTIESGKTIAATKKLRPELNFPLYSAHHDVEKNHEGNRREKKVAATQKTSKCPFCPKTFVTDKNRMQHVLFGQHHFRCEPCDMTFVNLSLKNQHELTTHSTDESSSKHFEIECERYKLVEKNLNDDFVVKVEPVSVKVEPKVEVD